MYMKSIQFVATLLASLAFTAAPVFAADAELLSKELWIGGYAYEAS